MIIWLASYPRSGNTLLRTILKQTMNLGSYSDEPPPANIGFTDMAMEEFGSLPIGESWQRFYEMATASKNVYLVKTHLPPRDNQPAIYIVRDGRSSLISYRKYHQKFFPEYSGGLYELVLGADYYGGWSAHYANWISRERRTLLLHYEDLVDATPDLLRSIAQFIGHEGPVVKWSNPFNQLQKQNPDFFRAGRATWQGAPEWTELLNGIFFLLHGDLMKAMGYVDQETIERARASLSPEQIEFVEVAKSIQEHRASLEIVCQERLAALNTLDARSKRLDLTRYLPVSLLKRLIPWVR